MCFEVKFERTIHEGDDYVDFLRRIVTLGVIPDDVPALYTMTTEPSLVFSVLHDPPGGGSLHVAALKARPCQRAWTSKGMHAGDLSDASGYQQSALGISVDLATWISRPVRTSE